MDWKAEAAQLRAERDTLYWLCEAAANGDKIEAAKIRAELDKINARHVNEFNTKLAKGGTEK